MEFYQAINNRRTVRDLKDDPIPKEVLARIIGAGIKAPTNNHLRDWEFVILETAEDKEKALSFVKEFTVKNAGKVPPNRGELRTKMYTDAMPKQYRMLAKSGCVIMPFFKAGPDFPAVAAINGLNSFAAVWCCVENILLAAAAEGLACSLRIPVGDEGRKAARAVNAPRDYVLPCYIGLGYPEENATYPQQVNPDRDKVIHFGKW